MEEGTKCLWRVGTLPRTATPLLPSNRHCVLRSLPSPPPPVHPPPGFTCKRDRMSADLPSWPVFKCAQMPCVGDMEEGQELS